MAMTKKEQSEMESLREQLRLAKALCWPTSPKPVSISHDNLREWSRHDDEPQIGWFGWGWDGGFKVSKGCSGGTTHSKTCTDKTTSQGGGRMFTSRDEAYLMARWEVCEATAKLLAQLDKEWEAGK